MEIFKFNHNGDSGEYIKRKDVDRMEILLKAAHDLLKKCNEGPYVKNALEETVFYDDADCDGFCLMEDIASAIGIED